MPTWPGGTNLAEELDMHCYFGSSRSDYYQSNGKSSVVMFHIPDIGIRFKAPFAGVDRDHSDLASLLALLEFIDKNQNYFANNTYQLYGDNLNVINQVNGQSESREEFEHLLKMASDYRDKYRFSLEWIPSNENSAFESLFD